MIGTTISHYKVTEKLGEGGMGVVYKADDTKLDRPVALKFLAPHLLRDEEGRKRFEREAKSAAKLDHPNICTVHEIDEADGRTFIAMAFLEGQPLSERIKEGPLKLPEALSVAIQIVWFKLTRRRVFLMAPIHHHFEFMAWSETKIMLRFWIVAAVCAGIGYTLYQNSIG